jgi:pullulanase/glycogen debranching enzyme
MKTKRLEFFEKDPIPWNGKYELEDFYKTLFALKSENPALRGGDPAVTTYWINTTSNDKVLAYLRKNGEREVLVLINTSKDAVNFKLEDDNSMGNYKNVFTNNKVELIKGSDVSLPAYGYLVYEK